MWNWIAKYWEWLAFLSFLGLLGGCTFHGHGTTTGSRELGLHYTVDTSLTWVTKSEGDKAENDETLGVEWTGFGPPAPPASTTP